jgi:hypothetical protein
MVNRLVAAWHDFSAARVLNSAASHTGLLPHKRVHNNASLLLVRCGALVQKFVSTDHLGVVEILDLVPSADGVIGKIGRGRPLGTDALKIHFADSLTGRHSRLADYG